MKTVLQRTPHAAQQRKWELNLKEGPKEAFVTNGNKALLSITGHMRHEILIGWAESKKGVNTPRGWLAPVQHSVISLLKMVSPQKQLIALMYFRTESDEMSTTSACAVPISDQSIFSTVVNVGVVSKEFGFSSYPSRIPAVPLQLLPSQSNWRLFEWHRTSENEMVMRRNYVCVCQILRNFPFLSFHPSFLHSCRPPYTRFFFFLRT